MVLETKFVGTRYFVYCRHSKNEDAKYAFLLSLLHIGSTTLSTKKSYFTIIFFPFK